MIAKQSIHGVCQFINGDNMIENQLIDLSKEFSVEIIKQISQLKEDKVSSILTNQLLKSSTSIGANIHEGNYAASKADFINKFQIALKECFETEYWLDILNKTELLSSKDYDFLITKCNKIRFLLSKSINTAKNKK